ncbi:TIGR03118 family protein [Edaphobacter bradus]|uniref:TIGR03118 family protein n=1 Tax=Edaphobacter bradus TaxID=2259016 RepID=UPI0021DF90A6|nr:TIGR03118 family protein [Edaphobacter bradus]
MRNEGLLSIVAFAAICLPAAGQSYKVTNIVSDGSVPATTMDANFINPWAVTSSPVWWISAQGTGFAYIVTPAGAIPFKVIVPAASGAVGATGMPAGAVTTAGATGMVLSNGSKANFLFSTLDGTISGWNSKLGFANSICEIVINNHASAYTGLAILNIATGGVTTNSYILAANFEGNAIEVYDNTFKPTKLAGSFTDPSLPPGYFPFSVHVLGTQVFVTYTLRNIANYGAGPGHGVVNVFDTTGKFVSRVLTFGNLNAPWGIAFAPANFGIFSNDLLVGNFGNGIINVYDPKTFAYLGQLMDATGKALTYGDLWELLPGGTTVTGTTSVSGGDTSTVYFTAGLANMAHGLFAGITNTTTAGGTPTFGFSASEGAATVTAGNSTQANVSVTPVNGFSGSVSLACSGLPAKATCTFSPSSLTVSPTAPATGTVTIQTTMSTTSRLQRHLRSTYAAGITSALLLPFASILAIRRRRSRGNGVYAIRLLGVMLLFVAVAGLIAGCSDNKHTVPGTPAGQSTVVMTASAGSVMQQTSIALTVQ